MQTFVLCFLASGWLGLLSTNRQIRASTPIEDNQALPHLLVEANRVVILGDSIAYSGQWISYLTCWMETQGTAARVINMAIPSETVSGLSENGHAGGKFPRPFLHERLDRVLRICRPDVVLACYGMNCGIYQPLDMNRFKKFQTGILRLHRKVEQTGAQIIYLTPPIYDQHPGNQGPAGSADYDAVLEHYSEWLLTKRSSGWNVIDVHGSMKKSLRRKRLSHPAFTFSPDTVHPGNEGHWAICRAILNDFGVPPTWAPDSIQDILPRVTKRLEILRNAYLSAAGHNRPGIAEGLPIDEAITQANCMTKAIRSEE